ncbi:MAG: alcohol dehydrogenase [Actinobacteria bacterium HGW-Actinobacteria-2]|nr:MAG: alcohol dehydrogenase [Actinobacteria bacterium HGW-Actinobacteria-2]
MRAVVYDRVGGPLELREVPAPECAPDGAVIAVQATGICRSDWHAWRGHDPVPLPMIPGHEFAGVVHAVGAEVRDFAVGDRVTVPFVNACGHCELCAAGQGQVCPNQTQPGFTHPGSYAEYVAVRAADFNLVRLPDAVDAVTAAALGCRFATAFHALTAQASVRPGDWVVVFGCGGVGLSAVLIAKALGAKVVGVDLSTAARDRALALGADAVLADSDPTAVIELTGGGAAVGVDALGHPSTAAASVRSLRRRGRHVQVGLMLGEAATASLPWGELVAKELEVVGSHGMAAVDYPAMLKMVADGRLDISGLLGRVVDLDQAPAELARMDTMIAPLAGVVVATVERRTT